MLQNAYWRFHLYKVQKSAKLICGIRVMDNFKDEGIFKWVGDKRGAFWDVDDDLFLDLRVGGYTTLLSLC